MRAVILGAGAVGQWLGALLARSGADTVLVARPARVPDLQRGVRLPDGAVPIPVVSDLAEVAPGCDWLVLAVKAFDAGEAARQAAALQPRRVLAVQNGVGSDEAVAAVFGAERVFVGSLTRAVGLEPSGELRPASRGGLAVAPMHPGGVAGDLLERLAAQPFEDWRAVKWSKLLLNLAANATCAILDELPPHVLGTYRLFALEMHALREALRAMRSLGLPVVDLPEYPVRAFARAVRSLPTAASFWFLGPRMARGRGEKPPSLLLDLRAGRPLTEVGFLNGAVARVRPSPVNAGLARIVEGLARGALSRDRFRRSPEALLAELRRGARGPVVEGPGR